MGPALVRLTAALLGKREDPVNLFALHLLRSTDRPSIERKREDVAEKGGPLAPLLSQAAEMMLDVRPLSFVSSSPPADITRTAQAKHASLVLLGAHKPLLLEGRLSGTVGEVASDSSCPVAVLVDRGLSRIERVLVAYAGGPEDLAALEVARRIGRAPGVELTLFHVVQPDTVEQAGKGRGQIDQVFSEPADGGTVRVRFVTHSSPADAVLEESRGGYDLLVLGMHARWGLEKGMLSLRRRRVLSESTVSILAVHPPALESKTAVEPAPSQLASSPV